MRHEILYKDSYKITNYRIIRNNLCNVSTQFCCELYEFFLERFDKSSEVSSYKHTSKNRTGLKSVRGFWKRIRVDT